MMIIRQKVGNTLRCVQTSFVITKHYMTKLSKTLLAVAVMGFVAGGIFDFCGFNVNPACYVALPLGAVAFGMFIISLMMEKEMSKFDEEKTNKGYRHQ
jgi:hypothetical protein